MASDRLLHGGRVRDDDWIPPAWDSAARDDGARASRPSPDLFDPRPEPPVAIERSPRLHEGGLVLGMAIAPGAVALLALLLSVATIISGQGSLPRGLILVLMAQAGGAAMLSISDHRPLLQSWIATLICSAVLLPLLALQVALLREPYVSWARGSASPALVATVVVGMIVVVGAVWAVATNWEHPDEAGLLFMPQALMVPALIGMHASIQQQAALRTLGMVMLLAAAATAMSWFLEPAERLFVPPGALAVEVLALWLTGHGPWFQATSGDIVRVLYCAMLALAVVLIVAVPITAMWVNHGARLVEQAQRARRRAARPPRPMSHGPVIPR